MDSSGQSVLSLLKVAFVDDLELSVEDGFVGVRSSSRVGDSDFGVNAKRLNFLSAALRGKGWDAPEIKT